MSLLQLHPSVPKASKPCKKHYSISKTPPSPCVLPNIGRSHSLKHHSPLPPSLHSRSARHSTHSIPLPSISFVPCPHTSLHHFANLMTPFVFPRSSWGTFTILLKRNHLTFEVPFVPLTHTICIDSFNT